MNGKNQHSGFPWSDHDVLLKELVAQKLTADRIAMRIGLVAGREVTKGMVIGRLRRQGIRLSDRPSPGQGRRARKALAGSAAESVAHRIREVAQSRKPGRLISVIQPQPIPEEAPRSACSILDLQFDSCRWIVGNPKKPLDPIYCGGKTFSGCYCREHWERSRGTGTPSERKAAA